MMRGSGLSAIFVRKRVIAAGRAKNFISELRITTECFFIGGRISVVSADSGAEVVRRGRFAVCRESTGLASPWEVVSSYSDGPPAALPRAHETSLLLASLSIQIVLRRNDLFQSPFLQLRASSG